MMSKGFPTYNEAADEYFTKLATEGVSSNYSEVTESIDEQLRILNQQKEYLEEINRSAAEKRSIGDIAFLNFSEIQGSIPGDRSGEGKRSGMGQDSDRAD